MTHWSRSRTVLVVGLVVSLVLVAIVFWLRWHSSRTSQQPLYHDSFHLGKQDDWQPFGGAWEVVDGVMRNNSDERGAKTMNGSVHLKDYLVEADVQFNNLAATLQNFQAAANEGEAEDKQH